VLCRIQPGLHTSHGGLLVQSQLYAATGLGREDSALPHTREMQKRRLDLGRGNMGVSEEFRAGKAYDSFIDETAARC